MYSRHTWRTFEHKSQKTLLKEAHRIAIAGGRHSFGIRKIKKLKKCILSFLSNKLTGTGIHHGGERYPFVMYLSYKLKLAMKIASMKCITFLNTRSRANLSEHTKCTILHWEGVNCPGYTLYWWNDERYCIFIVQYRQSIAFRWQAECSSGYPLCFTKSIKLR